MCRPLDALCETLHFLDSPLSPFSLPEPLDASGLNCSPTIHHLTRQKGCVHVVTHVRTDMDTALLHMAFGNRQLVELKTCEISLKGQVFMHKIAA